jgi:hypothetical protein
MDNALVPSPAPAPFDPSGLGSLPRVPIIPEPLLRRHHCLEVTDTRFQAAARLLQALWREDRDLPIGTHTDPQGRRRKLGSRISKSAGQAGANFLSPAIATLVRKELAYREIGAFIDESRLMLNLLSSMPLTFNLLAPLKLDLALATRVLTCLDPSFNGQVEHVLFEHSPARGHVAFTGDHTAFDACMVYITPNGRRGFVAIEVKYSEGMQDPVSEPKPRLDELSRSSELFVDPDSRILRTNPLQQLWREHLLVQAMLDHGLYDEGTLLFISPRLNWLTQNAGNLYQQQLQPSEFGRVNFVSMALEDVIAALATAGELEHAKALHRRYTDFWLVDGELSLMASRNDPQPMRSKGSKARVRAHERAS